MARHPMSSSWPQLTARTSVSGQSSKLALQEDIHRADGSEHDLHRHPRRRQAAAPHKVHDTGARSLWIGVQPQVSRRSHPVPCSAIRFQALLPQLSDLSVSQSLREHARSSRWEKWELASRHERMVPGGQAAWLATARLGTSRARWFLAGPGVVDPPGRKTHGRHGGPGPDRRLAPTGAARGLTLFNCQVSSRLERDPQCAASARSGSLLVAVRPRLRLSAGVHATDLTCAAASREPRRTPPDQAFNPWVQGSSPWRPTCENVTC
jgi:hypothetical protein